MRKYNYMFSLISKIVTIENKPAKKDCLKLFI